MDAGVDVGADDGTTLILSGFMGRAIDKLTLIYGMVQAVKAEVILPRW